MGKKYKAKKTRMDLQRMKRISALRCEGGPDPETAWDGGEFLTSVESVKVFFGDKVAAEYARRQRRAERLGAIALDPRRRLGDRSD